MSGATDHRPRAAAPLTTGPMAARCTLFTKRGINAPKACDGARDAGLFSVHGQSQPMKMAA